MSVSPKSSVPGVRVRAANDADARSDGAHVLYWMTAARRTRHNFGLQRAVDWARELKKPLVVLEAVRVGYRWASDRHHAFLLAGMADNQAALEKRGVAYHAYVEPKPDAGKGLLAALAKDACVVVADDWPCFFLPRMLAAASEQVPVRMEAVDSNGLLPIRAVDKAFARAYDLRRVMQRELGAHLQARPKADPLAGPRLEPHPGIPAAIQKRWPAASDDLLAGRGLDALPIDASFIALVNHAFTLSERDAATFVDAFCASERLTAAFCEDAFDAVYAAYARRAPEDELTTLLELAKIFTTQYKMRAMPLETRVLDETLDAGRRCAAGDVDEAEARARIRDILERAFAIEGLKQRDYIIALREYRVKLERDSRSGKSYALEFLEADETLVAELCDPDSELRASEACRRELIVATDVIFRALDGFLEVAAR